MRKGLFIILLAFFLLLLPSVKGQSIAACSSDPVSVKIEGHSYTSTSIQDAYNHARDVLSLPSFTLLLAGEVFTENLNLNKGGAVVLDGGYDFSFLSKTSPSSVRGTITISTGSLTVAAGTDSPKVVSNPQACAFDSDGDGYTSIGSCTGRADDCNDDDGSINPGAAEIPYDGIDQDCNGGDLTFAEDNLPNGGNPDTDNCGNCHGILPAEWDDIHASVPAPNGTCAACHNATVSNILPGHYGKTVRTAGNNMPAGATIVCASCHDQVSDEHNFGANIVMAKVFAAWANNSLNCDTCHEDRTSMHATATAHNYRVIDSSCAACHTSDTTVLGSPGAGTLVNQADVDILHRSDCALCHDYSGTVD